MEKHSFVNNRNCLKQIAGKGARRKFTFMPLDLGGKDDA